MLDSLLNVTILLVGLGQLLVSFTSLIVTLVFFTNVEELCQVLDGKLELTHLFVDKTYLLIALGFFVFVVCSLGSI
jgi:hypothetical protein